jgi:hypothetical protein
MTNKFENFHVQAYFLHNRLLSQYLSAGSAARINETLSSVVGDLNVIDHHYSLYERYVAQIYATRPLELSLWLLQGRSVGDSALVTTTQAFYFKKEGETRRYFSNKLAADRTVALRGAFSTSRCVGDTGQDLLRNQRRVTVLAHAVVSETGDEPIIELTPLFMGLLVERGAGEDNPVFLYEDRREVYPSQLDEFAKIAGSARPSKYALDVISKMPEDEIKECFAQILGQPFVGNDWGGETSDLSTLVTLNGVPKSAAFAFKGPSIKGKSTVSKMGKNGDQGQRLFHESIDLAVVQYYREIVPAVRSLMEDLARSRGKRFMILDGFQTAIILNAYGFIPPKGKDMAI